MPTEHVCEYCGGVLDQRDVCPRCAKEYFLKPPTAKVYWQKPSQKRIDEILKMMDKCERDSANLAHQERRPISREKASELLEGWLQPKRYKPYS